VAAHRRPPRSLGKRCLDESVELIEKAIVDEGQK
jgi:hypothetical protein